MLSRVAVLLWLCAFATADQDVAAALNKDGECDSEGTCALNALQKNAKEQQVSADEEATGCRIAEQGTSCQHDHECDGHFACCQDTQDTHSHKYKVGVKPCHQCTKTCHPETHKCKCN